MRLAVVATCALLFIPAFASAEKSRGATPGRHVLEGDEVSVYNIAGEMRVVRGAGPSVIVEVTPQGRDAGRLRVSETTIGGHPALRVMYPEYKIVYPDFGFGPPNGVNTDSYLGYGGHRVRVTGRGPGLEAHADIRIAVPRGKRVNLHLAVGPASISGVEGEIRFEGASSAVDAENLSGALAVETGSGTIRVSRAKGTISVETGSGEIQISEVEGSVRAEAGSGGIELTRIGGEKIAASAGSGTVSGSDLRASELRAEAGSGEVDLDGASASKLSVDSGSGSIRVRLLKNADDVHMDAASGSITLEAPGDLSARFRIECPRKHLHIDFPAEIESGDDDVTVGRIGDGKGRISIDAGSGSVRLIRI